MHIPEQLAGLAQLGVRPLEEPMDLLGREIPGKPAEPADSPTRWDRGGCGGYPWAGVWVWVWTKHGVDEEIYQMFW